MKLSIIVAMDKNRIIGRNDDLPWRLSADLQKFKKVTMGKPIVMGRKTHESIGRPLPGRENIILTRDPDYSSQGCTVISSISALFDYCHDHEEVMITGGAEIYSMLMDRVHRIYLTEVHAEVEGDTWFPPINIEEWQVVEQEDYQADEKNEYDFSFLILDRKKLK